MLLATAAALALLLLAAPAATAAAGDLDVGFGTDGALTTSFGPIGEFAQGVAVQPDGKLVAAGYTRNDGDSDFALARYNPDGTLDGSFGNAGEATTNVGDDSAYD